MSIYTLRITKDVLERSRFYGFMKAGSLAEDCAIKIALSEILPRTIVTGNRIYIDNNTCGRNEFIKLPKTALDFIKKFDALNPEQRVQMDEFEFKIEINEKHIAEAADVLQRA